MRRQNGYIILITILILGAMAGVIIGFLLLTGQNASIASNSVVGNTNDKAAAGACAQLALAAIKNDNNLATPATGAQIIDSTTGQSCTYSISGSSPDYTIAAVGKVEKGAHSYVHRLTIVTSQVSPQISISSWLDTP